MKFERWSGYIRHGPMGLNLIFLFFFEDKPDAVFPIFFKCNDAKNVDYSKQNPKLFIIHRLQRLPIAVLYG